MKLYKYDSYSQYKEIQIEANKRKIDWVWVQEESMKAIRDYRDADTILCHGSRNGTELDYFRKYYSLEEIVGTDISPTAKQYPNMMQWDFHDPNYHWIGHFDIVYSNSLDHSPTPKKAVARWLEQINEGGNVFIEWGEDHGEHRQTEIDPFGASLDEYRELFPVKDEIETSYSTILVL
jgi:hypothetical protein